MGHPCGKSLARHRVRMLNGLYADCGHGFRCDGDPLMAILKVQYDEEVSKLENLTTAQLLDIATKEGADVALRFGKGQRARFIDAIARKRAGF